MCTKVVELLLELVLDMAKYFPFGLYKMSCCSWMTVYNIPSREHASARFMKTSVFVYFNVLEWFVVSTKYPEI